MFSKEIKEKVIKMRQSGKSLEEIKYVTEISKGTLSMWLKNITLDDRAVKRLLSRQIEGRKKVSEILSRKRIIRKEEAKQKARETLTRLPLSTKEQDKLTCALIYYCEGTKSDQRVGFTNSDPELMRSFLSLLRKGFELDESRFRACIHLHSYHDEKVQKAFWSRTMNIPEENFIKSYKKKEGGLYIRKDYPGCATVRYHDAALARELLEIARQYFKITT